MIHGICLAKASQIDETMVSNLIRPLKSKTGLSSEVQVIMLELCCFTALL